MHHCGDLGADLARANMPANRAKTPWIVVYGHRPMYCNVAAHNVTTNTSGCDGEQEQSRNGAQTFPGSTSGGEPGSTEYVRVVWHRAMLLLSAQYYVLKFKNQIVK